MLAMPAWAQINLLHEFAGAVDGGSPNGALVLSGSTLYGMTTEDGNGGYGTIFKIQVDGTGYEILHEFAGGADDGASPCGSLIISGTTLFGMTECGGDNDKGTIFRVEIDGTSFALLHEFAGGADDGSSPWGSLVLSASTLYGLTKSGGNSNFYFDPLNANGTLFKIQTDGSGFALLHRFACYPSDGDTPIGALTISGSALYGLTNLGGAYGWGTIFKIQTDGADYALLHSFAGRDNGDGGQPWGSLLLAGSTLYGMTNLGAGSDGGTIFKIGTDGNGYEIIHEFSGYANDGASPFGSLILYNSALCGMTNAGGNNGLGTIFKIETDGSGLVLLHEFAGGADDGASPYGSLIFSGSTFFGTTFHGGDSNKGAVFSLPVPPGIVITSPSGGESWMGDTVHNITWYSLGTTGGVKIDYSIDNGSSWTPVGVDLSNSGLYAWLIPNISSSSCQIRVQEAEGSLNDISGMFSIIPHIDEVVSTPSPPSGPTSEEISVRSSTYSTGGSFSNWGDDLEYLIDWGDGSDYPGWLPVGTTIASHRFLQTGTYNLRAKARCATHTGVESPWSDSIEIVIYDGGSSSDYYYNSPTQYKALPEVIWSPATGGGTWMSEVQVTDVSGGSKVYVYYNTASGRRGPFLLWDNSKGRPLSSMKCANLLETIDSLDSKEFTYYGTVGAVEFITQDDSHRIQAAARTLNGSYSKTFPALSRKLDNMIFDFYSLSFNNLIIPNLSSNSTNRSACGLFNPKAFATSVYMRLFDAGGAQVGSWFSKTLDGYGYSAFDPFSEAGVPYPGNSYDNIVLIAEIFGGEGEEFMERSEAFCFGATANNVTNDPAAHIAKSCVFSTMADNGSSHLQILPETIWSQAAGGGTWVTEVQVVDIVGGSQVSVYFNYGGGSRRGPFTLWAGASAGSKVKYANILEQLATLDSSFNYYGKVGALEFVTQDIDHFIQVTARTMNGDYSKTFPGLNLVNADTANISRSMLIQNLANNAAYRSTCGFYNPTAESVTVEFTLLDGQGTTIGAPPFRKTLVGHDFQSFNPFNEALVPYLANSYDNVILRVQPTSGAGLVMCFGASVNNTSNDPASHLAVQGK